LESGGKFIDSFAVFAYAKRACMVGNGTYRQNTHVTAFIRFRPCRTAHQGIMQTQVFLNEGNTFIIELDLEKFFDKVNHDRIMSLIMRKVTDTGTLNLIRQFLRSGIMEGGVVSQPIEGTPQGSPLSPLLSNILLDELEKNPKPGVTVL
jgi:retron-type reverse transcriptase